MTTNFTCYHLFLEILTKLNTKTSRDVIYPLQKLTPQPPNLKISFVYCGKMQRRDGMNGTPVTEITLIFFFSLVAFYLLWTMKVNC